MKKTLLGLVAIAAIVAGCSKNTVTDVNVPAADNIALAPSTTRATIATLSTMKAAVLPVGSAGFKAYGITTGATTWYTDGTTAVNGISHAWDGTIWNFAPTPVAWPGTSHYTAPGPGFPLNFYAWFPFAPAGIGTITADPTTATPTINFVYTVQPTVANQTVANPALQQVDLLSGVVTAIAAKPASSVMPMTFTHALTKVDFGVAAYNGYNVYVQAVGIKNVAQTGTFDAVNKNWSANTTYGSDFNYYNWFLAAGAPLSNVLIPELLFPGVATNNAGNIPNNVASPFFTASTTPTIDNGHLMLMPQTPTSWAPALPITGTTPAPPAANATLIQMIYRCQSATDVNFIGYLSASSHPAYVGSATQARGYTGPLYVKVGYNFGAPVTNLITWTKGFGYTYNIDLPGTTGGNLIDQYYYDQFGNKTDLTVGAIDPSNDPVYPIVPQPILGDDYIHLAPIITPWADQTPTTVLGTPNS